MHIHMSEEVRWSLSFGLGLGLEFGGGGGGEGLAEKLGGFMA